MTHFIARGWLAAAALVHAAAAPAAPPRPEQIDAVVRAEMARQKVPGMAVAVVKDGRSVRASGYGAANVEHTIGVKPETVFQSGSLGKMFTAAAVLALAEDGKLSLEDPITRFLPEAPWRWHEITVRHLLTHTSGIPDYEDTKVDLRKDYTEDELARYAFGMPLEFQPGTRWSYSNTGYLLLGIVIRKASGQFYGELLRERFFRPLGMKTAAVISEADIVPNRAAGYRLVAGELKNQEWVSPTFDSTADGSLYLSLRDWLAWEAAIRARQVLRPASWEAMFTPARLRSGSPYPYGFGWFVDEVRGQRLQRHDGEWQGFTTCYARYLDADLTVIVLTNLGGADPCAVVTAIATLYDPRLTEPTEPIADPEPAVTERLGRLLAAAADGALSPEELAHVRAGYFPEHAKAYQERLRGAGALTRLELLEARTVGDDRVYRYRALCEKKRLRVRLGIAPDGKISALSVRDETEP